MRTKEERSELLRAACKDITPEVVVQKILDNEEQYSIEAYWVASNYENALAYIDILKSQISLMESKIFKGQTDHRTKAYSRSLEGA